MAQLTRREFAGAAALVTARSYAQINGAGERLRIGVIGCGGMAMEHMKALVKMREADNLEIVAVCDIFDKRAQAAAQLTGGRLYRDYRQVLALKEVDYVLIATPEHWHYRMAMDAAAAGKHIYCEKPMTQTSQQSKALVARVRETGVKMQVGVQGMSDDSYADRPPVRPAGRAGQSRGGGDRLQPEPGRRHLDVRHRSGRAAWREPGLERLARSHAQEALGPGALLPVAPLLGLLGRDRHATCSSTA